MEILKEVGYGLMFSSNPKFKGMLLSLNFVLKAMKQLILKF